MPSSAHAGSEGSRRDPELKRLLIRPGAIGDTLVWLPAAEFCQPSEIWCSHSSLIPGAHSLASTGIDLLELGLADRARRAMERFDSIYSWYGSNRKEFRDVVADLPVRFFDALPDGSCHAVDFYMRQVGGPDGAVPQIHVQRPRRPFIAIHPFSGSPRKNWPLQAFQELASRLPLPVEFTHEPYGSLPELAEWLASARLYIGNDTGPTHLAAAVGTPVIAIFRSTDPRVWAPRGHAPVEVVLSEPERDEYRTEMAIIARHAERLIELDSDR